MSSLPARCNEHPLVQVRHVWTRKQYVMNGLPAGMPIDSEHRYECAACGKELMSPEEYEVAIAKATSPASTPSGEGE